MSTPCITTVYQPSTRAAIVPTPHIVFADGIPIAVCVNLLAAERIAELLATHGLATIPDTP